MMAISLLAIGHTTSWQFNYVQSSDKEPMPKINSSNALTPGLITEALDSTPVAFTCGIFIDSVQATSTSPDSIYFDGFGNRYMRNFANPAVSTLRDARSSSYFNIEFKEPSEFSTEIQDLIQTVFAEISANVPQRELFDECNNPLPQYWVNIEVQWEPFLDEDVVAAARPMFYPNELSVDCSQSELIIQQSQPQRKINGHYTDPNAYDGVDGIILLNPAFENDFDTDYPLTVDPNKIDLYTTIMHEAFHILGFQSLIRAEASSILSSYDRLLYVSGDDEFMITPNCTSHCKLETYDGNEKTTLFQTPCAVSVGIGGPKTADLSSGAFSHLAADGEACDGAYLMQAVTPPGTRRYPQASEWNILCKLGYQVEVDNAMLEFDCDGCYLFAEQTIRSPQGGGCMSGDCCQHDYHTCDDEIEIDIDDLLCRVYSNNVSSLSIVDVQSRDLSAIAEIDGDVIRVERTNDNYGGAIILFTVVGCDNCQSCDNCQTEVGSIFVVFDQCIPETCEPNDDCENLLCIDDFDDFEKAQGVNFGYPYIFEGFCNNSPDIFEHSEGFNFINLNSRFGESVCFAFDDVAFTHCDLELEIKFELRSTDAALEIWTSASPPCTNEFVPFGCGSSISMLCADQSTYAPACTGLELNTTNYTENVWHTESFELSRSNLPSGVGYIILSATGVIGSLPGVVIHNIALRPVCNPDYDVTTNTECLEACFSVVGSPQSALWDFGDGNTSTDINPCHEYLNPGTYQVSVVFGNGLCFFEQEFEVVVVDPNYEVTVTTDCLEACFVIDGSPQSVNWDFGDGNSSTSMAPCHTYAMAGVYQVTVTYSTTQCEYEEVIDVVVFPCGGVDYCEQYGEITPDWVVGSDPCSVTSASSIWTGNSGINDKKIEVNGTLVIDKTISFSRCQFEMGPHAEIIVSSGKTFDVNSSIFYGCEYLWRSIRVAPGGIIELRAANPSLPTIVSGAWAGVFAQVAASLNLSNTIFDCNMVGVYIPPSELPSVSNMINIVTFNNLRFVGSNLLPPFTPSCTPQPPMNSNFFTVSPLVASYAGVLMYDVAPINLSANSMATSNLYSNMRSGIVAERSDLTVENSVFRDLQHKHGSDYPYKGHGIVHYGDGHTLNQKGLGKHGAPSFQNVRFPIKAQGTHLTATDNRIVEKVVLGIWTTLCKNREIVIEDNYIEANGRGLNFWLNDPVQSVSVKNNDVYMVSETAWMPQYAIGLFETGLEPLGDALYNDNVLHNLHSNTWAAFQSQGAVGHNIEGNIMTTGLDGLRVLDGNEVIVRYNGVTGPGNANGIGIRVESSPRSLTLCNNMTANKQGLAYYHTSFANIVGQNIFHGDFTDALYYNPTGYTSPQTNMKNEWCGNTVISGGFEAKHEDPALAPWSEYKVLISDGVCLKPDPVYPTNGWFNEYSVLSNPLVCNEYDRSRRGVLTEFERLIAEDSIVVPENAPAWSWNLRSDLYRILTEWPDTNWTGTVYEDFLAQMDTSDVGIWYAIGQDINLLMQPVTELEALQSDIRDTVSIWMVDITGQFEILSDSTTSSLDSIQAVLAIDTLMLELAGFATYWEQQRSILGSLYLHDLSDMMMEVGLAPANDDWTEALQTVWSALLQIAYFGPDSLNGTLLANLDAIASECPLTHGRAVYLAGSLMADNFDRSYTYECVPIEPILSNSDLVSWPEVEFSILPNPTSDQLTLTFLSDLPDGEIHIVNNSGSLVSSHRVNGKIMTISVDHLPVGMYFISWKPQRGYPQSKVFTVQR